VPVTHYALSEPASTPATDSDAGVPGLRAFRSAAFRTALALMLLIIGVSLIGMLLLRQAGDADGQFGIDFGAYYLAAERVVHGEALYPPAFLDGPISAQGVDQYLYPPVVAQVLAPVTALSRGTAEMLWLLLQAAAVFAALWVGTGIGGARANLERALWCGVAATYFLPVFDTLWKGNVSGFLALSSVAVALGGAAAGVGAAAGALVKAVPGTLLPAALVADHRSRWATVLTLGIAMVVSFLLAPTAWLDYPSVVMNMLGGSADYATNISPAGVVDRLGLADPVAGLARALSLLLAVGCLGGSAWMARSRDGLPSAALLGVVALLLLPGSLWYHYLVILLPFAAIAWPRASRSARLILFIAAALITFSLVWLPLALFSAILLASTTLVVIWPPSTDGSPARLPSEATA
jgi:hypothetical protein